MTTMPFEMKIDGMAEVSELLEKLDKRAPAVAAKALYEGAAVMQKAIRREMDKIKTEPFKYARNGETRLPSPEEKEILENAGIGVAKFDRNGVEIDTSVGFNQSGYADVNLGHMSSQARTNYKNVQGKYGEHFSSKFAKKIGAGQGEGNKKPVGVIANAINSGTSFMKKQPFVRKGASSGSAPAMKAMKEVIETEFEAMTNK